MRHPCSNCPWRRDAPRKYWDPQHFKDIWRNCQDDGLTRMLCHCPGDLPPEQAREVICQGWARVLGLDAVGVRLAVKGSAVTQAELEDTDRPDLFSWFEEMMEANGVEAPRGTGKRNRQSGRGDVAQVQPRRSRPHA